MGTYHQIPHRSPELVTEVPVLRRDAGISYWFPFVVFYAVLANIPFWVACSSLGIFRNAWFCMEYVAIGLLALFVPRWATVALLSLAVFLDLLDGVCQTYFMVASQCLANLSAIRQFSLARLLAGFAVCLLMVLMLAVAWSFPIAKIKANYRWRTAACLLVFAAISLSVDGRTVFRRTGGILNYLHPKPLATDAVTVSSYRVLLSRVPTIRLLRKEIIHARTVETERRYPKSSLPARSAAAQAILSSGLMTVKNGQELPNLVVIVVESWGMNSESSVRNALISAYAQPGLSARYEVLQGTVPFFGSTVVGEARELCGNMMGFHLLEASAQELQGCLPDRLAALGYHRIAMHGMEGHMFDRRSGTKPSDFRRRCSRISSSNRDCLAAWESLPAPAMLQLPTGLGIASKGRGMSRTFSIG